MKGKEFSIIRHWLGYSQSDMARILCISPRTVQSYEEGRRNITPGIERQLYFLLAMKRSSSGNHRQDCWQIKECPDEWKQKCTAWEFKAGQFCWFLNGTRCQGKFRQTWSEKIELCRDCEVFKDLVPALI